ncbi:MAG: hypothetical protein IIZ39_09495, partial [Blautia sp.]|nr:hypothetical protein [Blautia sp.]
FNIRLLYLADFKDQLDDFMHRDIRIIVTEGKTFIILRDLHVLYGMAHVRHMEQHPRFKCIVGIAEFIGDPEFTFRISSIIP